MCLSPEPRKLLSTPVRRQNPTSSSLQQQGGPRFLAGVALVADVAEAGTVFAGWVARGRERILGWRWARAQVLGWRVVQE